MSTLPRSLLIGVDTLAGWGGQTPGLYASGGNQFYSKEPQTVPMPTVELHPDTTHPVPYDDRDEVPTSFIEELAVAGNTAVLQHDLGVSMELPPEEVEKQKKLLEDAIKNKKVSALEHPNTAFAASAFLQTYGQQLGLDIAATRAAITHKLMEVANCGDPRFELKALELLGKHSDIGLFTERSEVTINYRSPEALEEAIKERVKRLLNANLIDATPTYYDIEEELSIDTDVEQEEVEPTEEEVEPTEEQEE